MASRMLLAAQYVLYPPPVRQTQGSIGQRSRRHREAPTQHRSPQPNACRNSGIQSRAREDPNTVALGNAPWCFAEIGN